MEKTYLGDGVYAELLEDPNGAAPEMLRLTTENGVSELHVIYLEGPVYAALEAYVKRAKAR